jgi:hypothetical protein
MTPIVSSLALPRKPISRSLDTDTVRPIRVLGFKQINVLEFESDGAQTLRLPHLRISDL